MPSKMVTQTKYVPWADPYARNHSWLRGPSISRNGTTKTRKLTNAPTAPQTVAKVSARCNFTKTDAMLVVMPNYKSLSKWSVTPPLNPGRTSWAADAFSDQIHDLRRSRRLIQLPNPAIFPLRHELARSIFPPGVR